MMPQARKLFSSAKTAATVTTAAVPTMAATIQAIVDAVMPPEAEAVAGSPVAFGVRPFRERPTVMVTPDSGRLPSKSSTLRYAMVLLNCKK